jgi:phosphate transport system substrate-binding protein
MTARQLAWLLAALIAGGASSACNGTNTGAAPGKVSQLQGAGSTFMAPLQKKWREEYQKRHPEVSLNYEAVGSGEGTKRFLAGAVDFGASDAAMKDEDMTAVQRGAQLVPVTAGSIVLAHNIEGLGGDLKLKRDVYVDIFLGKITHWNDPRITAVNPGLHLPSDEIVRVVRSESSGTTFAFTNHLSAISEEWRDRGPGASSAINWPGNVMQANGNDGVAGRIKISKNAIGYVEYGFAERTGLAMAWLENKEGKFIRPHGGSGLATLLSYDMPDNLRIFFPDPEGKDSYPIVTYSWLLLYKKYDDPQKAAALKEYVNWCLPVGQEYSESLGYLRLPPPVVTRAMNALGGIS